MVQRTSRTPYSYDIWPRNPADPFSISSRYISSKGTERRSKRRLRPRLRTSRQMRRASILKTRRGRKSEPSSGRVETGRKEGRKEGWETKRRTVSSSRWYVSSVHTYRAFTKEGFYVGSRTVRKILREEEEYRGRRPMRRGDT